MPNGLVEMLSYSRWANLTLLEACRGLTLEQLAAQPPGISGSIGELMTHLVGSQQTLCCGRRVGSTSTSCGGTAAGLGWTRSSGSPQPRVMS